MTKMALESQWSDAYGYGAVDDTMSPRFKRGDTLYVDPSQALKPGDIVVCLLHEPTEDGQCLGYIKELVAQTATEVVLRQFNPPKKLRVDATRVRTLHKVRGIAFADPAEAA